MAGGERWEFVSTGLFVDITTITVDPAYVAAAARRASLPETAGQRRYPSLLLVVALVAVGGVWGTAARQTYDRAPAAERIRESLVADARERREATDRLAARVAALRRETADARAALSTRSAAERALSEELARLELATGGVRVRGPGIVVRLDDADDPGEDGSGRISDVDLQAVVNALWSAGAEAVAVNGRRVSALTAVRTAGETILVDYEPVTAPYDVAAVGDADVMEPGFGDSATARRFRTWVDAFGISFSVRRADGLDLPGSDASTLRYARVATPSPSPGGSASAGSTSGGSTSGAATASASPGGTP
ncbi:MAG TPA: DUF881 domain-containing protein [Mycobacteriales bacterium]